MLSAAAHGAKALNWSGLQQVRMLLSISKSWRIHVQVQRPTEADFSHGVDCSGASLPFPWLHYEMRNAH